MTGFLSTSTSSVDWKNNLTAIAINPCIIPNSLKETAGISHFQSECAGSIRHGHEILAGALSKYQERLLSISSRIPPDEHFSKESFVTDADISMSA